MKKAFIFPGQASQYVGMGKDIYDTFEVSRRIFDKANDIMGIDIKEVCFNGPEEELKKTYITQPAIFVHSVAVFEILKEKNILPDYTAGHSLGEYSALTASGALSFEDGLRLVKRRGELMYEAGVENPGTMAAIIGMTPEKVYELCDSVKEFGVIQPANFNSPGQIALSGDVTAVRKALEKAKELGAKRAIELVVSGAFHSPLMESAQEGLKAVLQETEIKNSNIPVYSNVEAKAVQDNAKIRELLYQQLTKPVLWQELIENMIKDGAAEFYEIGPGKVLKGLLKRIDRKVSCTEVGTSDNINNLEV
jgi:[acyl-carrier-protein] S-malonyltransferase